MLRRPVLCMIIAVCTACESRNSAPNNEAANLAEPVIEAANQPADVVPPEETGGVPNNRNLVEEGPIDPKSAQGAGQVLQSYAALLEQGRFGEARRLWSDGGKASNMSEQGFSEAFGKYSEIHAEIDAPRAMEGAAGSSYVDIPIRFYGKLKMGAAFSSAGIATLRRVNDVPGSTAEQRQWRIYRLDVQPPL